MKNKKFKINIAKVTTQEVPPIKQISVDEPQEFIEIEAEDMTLEEWIEYKKHKEERNARVMKKFIKEEPKQEPKRKYLTEEEKREQKEIMDDVLAELRY